MLRSVAITRIQTGLGFRNDQSDNIILALQEAQRLLERGRSLPYFLLEEDASFALPSGSADVALPARFLREKRDEGFHFTNSDDEDIELEKIDLDVGRTRFVNVDPGSPVAYALRRATVKFYPERDTSYSLTWSYYRGALPLTSDIENAWLEEEYGAPEALIGRAGMIIAGHLKNQDAMARFQQMYQEGWASAFADGILREEEAEPLYVGGKL